MKRWLPFPFPQTLRSLGGLLLLCVVLGLACDTTPPQEPPPSQEPAQDGSVREQATPDKTAAEVTRPPETHAPETQAPEAKVCQGCTLLKGGWLFDGQSFKKGDILLKGERIEAILTPGESVRVGTSIDITGKTVLPGLFDMHIHLPASAGPRGFIAPKSLIYEHLKAMLRAGVTSFLDLGSSTKVIFALRQRLKAGTLLGPHLFAVGPLITAPGGHPCPKGTIPGDSCLLLKEPSDLAKVEALLKQQPDALKVVVEAGTSFQKLERIELSLLNSLVEKAQSANQTVIAHVSTSQDVTDALDKGVRVFAHIPGADKMNDALLARLAKEKATIIPTLAVYDSLLKLAQKSFDVSNATWKDDVHASILTAFQDPRYANAYANESFKQWSQERMDNAVANFRACVKAGVGIAAGTDAGNPAVFHGRALYRELLLYTQHGMSIPQALQTATTNAANLLKQTQRGRLQPGAFADLLIVKGELEKDLTAINQVEMVFRNGAKVDRQALKIPAGTSIVLQPTQGRKEGETCLDKSECGEKLTCSSFDGVCVRECDPQKEADCPLGSVCFRDTVGAKTGYCLGGDGCDLFSQTCPNQTACNWLGNGATRCWYASDVTGGACVSQTCAPGFQCNFSTNQCYELCSPNSNKKKCGSIFATCIDLTDIAKVPVGACQ